MEINDMEQYQFNKEELECKIRNLINQVTESKYISPLDVKVDEDLYTLRLGLNCKDAASISFGYQGDEAGFLKFLEKEFRKRRLQDIEYMASTLINGDSTNFYYPLIEL